MRFHRLDETVPTSPKPDPQCRAACLFSGLSSGRCWQAAEEVRAQVAHKRTELLSDPATDERERKAKAALMTKIEAWLAEDVGESRSLATLGFAKSL